MPKIILFNGPPRSGKDTCTKMALEYLGHRAVHYRFASPLKKAIHALFGMPYIGDEHFDSRKNTPSPLFLGLTPGEAYIWLSENAVKPKFGSDFFAKVAVTAITNMMADHEVVVISDCGFKEEVQALLDAFGADNILLVHLYRAGTSFEGDSRSYVGEGLEIINEADIHNNGSLESLH